MTNKHIVYHIPVCPFSQRLEILLALRGQQNAVDFRVVDITKPRDPELLAKTRGTTALPVLETSDGRILKESLVILRYLDEVLDGASLRRQNPVDHAVESMLIAKEGSFTTAGYILVMNQDPDRREALTEKLLSLYRDITHSKDQEYRLKTSRESFRSLFEHVAVGVYISSKEGKFLDANPALLDMLGYDDKNEFLELDLAGW